MLECYVLLRIMCCFTGATCKCSTLHMVFLSSRLNLLNHFSFLSPSPPSHVQLSTRNSMAVYDESYLDVYSDSDGALVVDMKLYGQDDILDGVNEVAHAAAIDSNTLDVVYICSLAGEDKLQRGPFGHPKSLFGDDQHARIIFIPKRVFVDRYGRRDGRPRVSAQQSATYDRCSISDFELCNADTVSPGFISDP